jgi:hypothetical protein
MTEEKICSCDPVQGNIKPSEAVDFIRPDGKIVARYHKDCAVHGFKRIENEDTNDQKK